MHLYYPHHGSAAPSAATMMQKIFSPPRQNQSTNNKLFYSIFYTAAVTFPFVVTLVYYLILVPHNNGDFTSAFGLTDDLTDNLFGHGWFKPFMVFNKYGVNCLAALIEVFVLSSVKRQEVCSLVAVLKSSLLLSHRTLISAIAGNGPCRWSLVPVTLLLWLGLDWQTHHWRLRLLFLRSQPGRLEIRRCCCRCYDRTCQHL
jgi:hypothetical protein